jgi:hypothetical protein
MASTNTPLPPPPAYQDDANPLTANPLPGQTYYRPPDLNEAYPPPPVQHIPDTTGQNRFVAYYTPDNRSLAVKRRIFSCLCCFLILILIIGLAAGLTRSSYYGSRYCEW